MMNPKNMFAPLFRLCAFVGFTCLISVSAQTPAPSPPPGPTGIFEIRGDGGLRGTYLASTVSTEQLTSRLMGRQMPYRVLLPPGYDAKDPSAQRFPVVYLLHGLTGHFDNWTDKTRIAQLRESANFIIVTPEGENGWYTDSNSRPNDKFESYIIKELIPEIDKKFRTFADRDHRAIAGLSMGGYGALKFGVKYPEMFVVAGSFSGALGAASFTEKQIPGAIGKTVDAIFGPVGSDSRKSNDLFGLILDATPDKIRALPFLYLDCGTEDFLFRNNGDFVTLLVEKKVPHEYRQLPGGHNWTYWDKQVEEFLELAAMRMTGQK